MNKLALAMNSKLKDAVSRAQDQATLVDYDEYVGYFAGRCCLPEFNEDNRKGANRPLLFFYEMKTNDQPFLRVNEDPHHDELKRRDEPRMDPKDTLDGEIGSWIAETFNQHPDAKLDVDETNKEFDDSINHMKRSKKRAQSLQYVRRQLDSPIGPADSIQPGSMASGTGTAANVHASRMPVSKQNGTKPAESVSGPSPNRKGDFHSQASLFSYFIPDSVGRVFHPQQAGHALIANLIFYNMSVRKAKIAYIEAPVERLGNIGRSCPRPESQSCNEDSTKTWAARDPAKDGADKFCSNYKNLIGKKGDSKSTTFNGGSLDAVSLSIDFKDDITIGEGSCRGWLGVVIDGCDTNSNGNLKHGGSIDYGQNATIHFDPLVIRREFEGGKTDTKSCNGIDNNHYVTASNLDQNIKDYCSESASKKIGQSDTSFSKDFNSGTLDKVTLTTSRPKGKYFFQIFESECNYFLSRINDGCDVPSGGSNPLNWKHGGTMTSPTGVQYTIKPDVDNRAKPPNKPLGNCKS